MIWLWGVPPAGGGAVVCVAACVAFEPSVSVGINRYYLRANPAQSARRAKGVVGACPGEFIDACRLSPNSISEGHPDQLIMIDLAAFASLHALCVLPCVGTRATCFYCCASTSSPKARVCSKPSSGRKRREGAKTCLRFCGGGQSPRTVGPMSLPSAYKQHPQLVQRAASCRCLLISCRARM
jgi:hypothetical protein